MSDGLAEEFVAKTDYENKKERENKSRRRLSFPTWKYDTKPCGIPRQMHLSPFELRLKLRVATQLTFILQSVFTVCPCLSMTSKRLVGTVQKSRSLFFS